MSERTATDATSASSLDRHLIVIASEELGPSVEVKHAFPVGFEEGARIQFVLRFTAEVQLPDMMSSIDISFPECMERNEQMCRDACFKLRMMIRDYMWQLP